jgi:hypothetical protein
LTGGIAPNSVSTFGHVLVLVGGDDQRAADGLVDVDLRHLLAVRVRELLHGAHDGGHAAEAITRAVQRHRGVLQDVVEVGVVFGFFRGLGGRGDVRALLRGIAQLTVLVDDLREIVHGFAHEAHAVGHELHREC